MWQCGTLAVQYESQGGSTSLYLPVSDSTSKHHTKAISTSHGSKINGIKSQKRLSLEPGSTSRWCRNSCCPTMLSLCPHHSPGTLPSKMTQDLLTAKPQGLTSLFGRLKANAHTFLGTPMWGNPRCSGVTICTFPLTVPQGSAFLLPALTPVSLIRQKDTIQEGMVLKSLYHTGPST